MLVYDVQSPLPTTDSAALTMILEERLSRGSVTDLAPRRMRVFAPSHDITADRLLTRDDRAQFGQVLLKHQLKVLLVSHHFPYPAESDELGPDLIG